TLRHFSDILHPLVGSSLKFSGATDADLTSVMTTASTRTGRQGSSKSSAKECRPHRGRCRKPKSGSSPAISHALTISAERMAYPKDSMEFTGSLGGRLFLPSKRHSRGSSSAIQLK